jgi:prepilin-type N-terminal cleavage/methylation domain-containing protein
MKYSSQKNSKIAGYTLLELLMVVIIIGVLATLMSAGFLGWLTRMRVTAARDAILQVIRETQQEATARKTTMQASFRDTNGRVEYAIHDAGINPTLWRSIEYPNIRIDTSNTTFAGNNTLRRVQFNHKGHTNGQLGRITLTSRSGTPQRCVIVSTLLGAVRTANDRRCRP